jgi:hypothetical protein
MFTSKCVHAENMQNMTTRSLMAAGRRPVHVPRSHMAWSRSQGSWHGRPCKVSVSLCLLATIQLGSANLQLCIFAPMCVLHV